MSRSAMYQVKGQDGVFTRGQLAAVGWTMEQIRDHCTRIEVVVPTINTVAEADKRLRLIRNACTAVYPHVESYNVSIDCSAAMRAVIEAMIDVGYRKP